MDVANAAAGTADRFTVTVRINPLFHALSMARVLITGSADGLGLIAAQRLIAQKHRVVLHARTEQRALDALRSAPGAEHALIGDLARLDAVQRLAVDANTMGRFDAVIHNAGVYRASSADILAVNTLAPYVLTCLMQTPDRLIYLGSGEHRHGEPVLDKLHAKQASFRYSDSKLMVLLLAKAVARKWPDVRANVVDPGWVPTKMGGASAPDDLEQGVETQTWLAVSTERTADVSGRYLHHKRESRHHPAADNVSLQDEFIATCERVTGVPFPNDRVGVV